MCVVYANLFKYQCEGNKYISLAKKKKRQEKKKYNILPEMFLSPNVAASVAANTLVAKLYMFSNCYFGTILFETDDH